MVPLRFRIAPALLVCLIIAARMPANDNWPQWRGPNGNGTSDSTNLPMIWNAQTGENIAWKIELPAWSGSTPVIWGDHIFLTSPSKSDDNAQTAEAGGKGKGPGSGGPPGGKGGARNRPQDP